MKKMLIAGLVGLALFSCSLTGSEDAALPGKGEVKSTFPEMISLIHANTITNGPGHFGGYFTVLVKNTGFEKDVVVHFEQMDGSWWDIPLHFERIADAHGEYEIWSVDYHWDNTDVFGEQFVLKYTVNGITYWNNNDGQNFKITPNQGSMLGEDINVFQDYGWRTIDEKSTFAIRGKLHLRHHGQGPKDVKIIYTKDGWQSQTEIPATVLTPANIYGAEYWEFVSHGSPAEEVEYYIRYSVEDRVYYDNNFGRNYQYKNKVHWAGNATREIRDLSYGKKYLIAGIETWPKGAVNSVSLYYSINGGSWENSDWHAPNYTLEGNNDFTSIWKLLYPGQTISYRYHVRDYMNNIIAIDDNGQDFTYTVE